VQSPVSSAHLVSLESVVARMADARNAEDAITAAVEGIVALPHVDAVACHEIDRATGMATMQRGVDLTPRFSGRFGSLDISQTPFHNVFLQRQPVFVSDTTLLGDRAALIDPFQSLCMVPVVATDDCIGSLTALRRHVRDWSHEDQLVLPAIGRELGSGLARLKAQGALRDRRLPLCDLFDSLGEMIVVTAADGRMIWANRETEARLGYAEHHWQRMTMLDFYPPGRRLEAAAVLADLLEHDGGVSNLPLSSHDGVPVPVRTKVRWGTWDGRKVIYMSSREEMLDFSAPQLLVEGAMDVVTSLTMAGNPETAQHCRRVSRIAGEIGEAVGLDPQRLAGLRLAAGLHDVGKIAIPSEVLSSPRKLTPEELALVRAHPSAGHQIVSRTELPPQVDDVVLQHHERLDGSGYPNGLVGSAIGMDARIVAVADVAEAMTAVRAYRRPHPTEAALRELTMGRGRAFDGDIVDAFMDLLQRGSPVLQ
jgi:putative nucleotidyltransferase with HDIG domain/PAS domain S-box-containing protein